MINLWVDSHGNHPGRGRKRGGGATKRVKVTLDEYTKMTARGGDFCLIKKGIVLGTIAHASCQFVSPYFKFIAYKLTLEIIKKMPAASQAAL